ncbi:zinc finger MYM-type protein 1-like [Diabrotica virgifera virgifera]|uniref:DUF4371 domain-containing protein n=1 Tax=Diabrotica virgifera virgifera TaxID=50390 RepID=A0ABM5L2Q0_DIAVI|nr:zinc finger MYM-type protein 1-like [Diabrotica virgifera virgifera]
MLFEKQLLKRKKEVFELRQVASSIINVLKLIGKQGLAIRGQVESAYSFDDPSVNHGNFLEIIFLLCNYDKNLEAHINKAMEISKTALEAHKASSEKQRYRGRGSQLALLSKTTINKFINIIKELIQKDIVEEIKQAIYYSVQMDSTTDVSGFDQCIITLRYVNRTEVKERIISLKRVHSATGENLFKTILETFLFVNLDVKNCIADSFDGAANMSGEYNGVSSKFKQLQPNHIHTWCEAHTLNLVLSDTAECVTTSISFFSLLQQTHVFIKDSHKRLEIYLKQNPNFRLTAIGATRWRSKSDSTCKIFGHFDKWSKWVKDDISSCKCVYLELIISLSMIANSPDFNSKVRNEANSLLQKFTSFEIILTAMMFLLIFKTTTPLSNYLQTKNLDYVQAWHMVASAQTKLEDIRNNFPTVLDAAQNFAKQ